MNLQQLITFSTVIAEGSMTAAAEKLYLTQPAVSQQIRNLEEEMGVNLLLRGTRQARPTTQGQLLYDYAKKIIALTQQAQVAVQTMGEGIQGHLRVGTLNSLGLYLISPLVGGFLKHNPKTQISLSYEDGHQVLQALKKGELDVAILPDVTQEYGLDTDGLDGRVLMKDEIWLVASSKDVAAPTQVSMRELSERPMVRFSEKYFGFEKVLNAEAEKQKVKMKTVFECNNVGTVKRVIESGLGWGFLPAHSIRKQVRAGRMTAIEVNEIKHSVPVVYYVRKSELNSQITETFYRAVKQPVGNGN
jgi:DNA-binding transcriptional LysR family regulator